MTPMQQRCYYIAMSNAYLLDAEAARWRIEALRQSGESGGGDRETYYRNLADEYGKLALGVKDDE